MYENTSVFALSLLGFIFSPLIYLLSLKNKNFFPFLDAFSLFSVGSISLIHLIPESIEKGGFISFLLIVLGLVLPSILKKITHHSYQFHELLFLFMSFILHTILESAGISTLTKESHLAPAIILHNFPVGLILFATFQETKGTKLASLVMFAIVVAAMFGFLGGEKINEIGNKSFHYYLEAFIAATLLHLIFEKPHFHKHVHEQKNFFHIKDLYLLETLGAIFGILFVVYFVGQPNQSNSSSTSLTFLDTFINLSLESAPALLIAYFLSGLIKFFLTPSNLEWMKQGNQFLLSLKGVVFGLPLPICSCGVIPLYRTLITQGVPASSSIGFLIATPELGLDAILLSLPLLGKEMMFARLIAAFVVAISVAYLVGKWIPTIKCNNTFRKQQEINFFYKLKLGFRYGFVDLLDHTMPWILLGLFLASILEPLLGYEFLNKFPSFLQVPIFTILAVPIYVCASGATPIAAIAIHKGISLGAALAFLISGPATNLTTFGVLSQLHGKKIAFLFGLSVVLFSIFLGWTVDFFLISKPTEMHKISLEQHGILQWISLGILACLFLVSILRQGPRGVLKQITEPIHSH